MFARKIRVEYEQNGRRIPCPLKWLDSFSMRNFTNASVFDNTQMCIRDRLDGKRVRQSRCRPRLLQTVASFGSRRIASVSLATAWSRPPLRSLTTARRKTAEV